jgi:hypothetical protein
MCLMTIVWIRWIICIKIMKKHKNKFTLWWSSLTFTPLVFCKLKCQIHWWVVRPICYTNIRLMNKWLKMRRNKFIHESNIGIAYRSDHSPVYLTFQFTEHERCKKRTWMFNNCLLQNEEYIKIRKESTKSSWSIIKWIWFCAFSLFLCI